jgi:ATP-dependent helicase/nuclease subunit B
MRFIVPTERHVERLSRDGARCETRAALRQRLLEALAPEVVFASPEMTRMALADALGTIAPDEPLLAPLSRGGEGAGSRTWLRTVDAVDDAIALLRAANVPAASLEGQASGTSQGRARMLRLAMVALDDTLSAKGLMDPRLQGAVLARAIARAEPEAVELGAGSARFRARFVVGWDPIDLSWWRALDAALKSRGGGAIIELPSFNMKLDAARDRGPLEIVFDDVARGLGEPPETVALEPMLGDLSFTGDVPFPERVQVVRTSDAEVQARAVADAVHAALAGGTPIEELAILVPRFDEGVMEPIVRALDDLGLSVHDPRGSLPEASALCKTALEAHALASRGLLRQEVAELLRSRYVDASAVTGIEDGRDARRLLMRLATALEQTPTVSGGAGNTVAELEATARAAAFSDEALVSVARRVGEILWKAEAARTRLSQVQTARELFSALGLPARVGYDARTALARDEAPRGIARAELHALAQDAHSWRVLAGALDAYENAVRRLGASSVKTSGEAFRHELSHMLAAGSSPSGARRAFAIRMSRATELAAEPLSCLIVVDANEGILPAARSKQGLVSESLGHALRDASEHGGPPSPGSMAARDLAMLSLAVEKAKKVTFVFRSYDAEGAAMAPSPLVLWLERGGVNVASWASSPLRSDPLTEREVRLHALLAEPERREILARDATRRAAVELSRESFHGVGRVSGDWTSQLPENARVAGILAEETGGGERPLPVTAIERFARCAFQGYAAQVLGAREEVERTDTPDAREQGTLVHEALAAAFTATREMWSARPRDAEAIRVRAMEAADRCLGKDASKSALRRIALEQTREDVRRVLEWSLADEAWDFLVAEQAFGDAREAEGWPALSLGELSVRGKIDRVDRSHDGKDVRVVDYKRGARTAKESQRDVAKTAFQVPLYAHVTKRVLDARSSGGVYLPTLMLDPSYAAGFAAAWDEAMGEGEGGVVPRTLGVVEGIRRGVVAPLPPDERVCDRCPYDGACRRPRFVVTEDEEVATGGEGGEGS